MCIYFYSQVANFCHRLYCVEFRRQFLQQSISFSKRPRSRIYSKVCIFFVCTCKLKVFHNDSDHFFAIYSFLRCEWVAKHGKEDEAVPEFSPQTLPLYFPKVNWKLLASWHMYTQPSTGFHSHSFSSWNYRTTIIEQWYFHLRSQSKRMGMTAWSSFRYFETQGKFIHVGFK